MARGWNELNEVERNFVLAVSKGEPFDAGCLFGLTSDPEVRRDLLPAVLEEGAEMSRIAFWRARLSEETTYRESGNRKTEEGEETDREIERIKATIAAHEQRAQSRTDGRSQSQATAPDASTARDPAAARAFWQAQLEEEEATPDGSREQRATDEIAQIHARLFSIDERERREEALNQVGPVAARRLSSSAPGGHGAAAARVAAAQDASPRRPYLPFGQGPWQPLSGVEPVDAELIRALYLGLVELEGTPVRVTGAGVRLHNALVVGELNVQGLAGFGGGPVPALDLTGCYLRETPRLDSAHFRRVSLTACLLPGLGGTYLRLDGGLFLNGCTIVPHFEPSRRSTVAEIALDGANIQGPMLANEDYSQRNLQAHADILTVNVTLAAATVSGRVFIANAFRSPGPVEPGRQQRLVLRAPGAKLGAVDLFGSPVVQVDMEGATIAGNLMLQRVVAGLSDSDQPALVLRGAHVRGDADLSGCSLAALGTALDAERLTLEGHLDARAVYGSPFQSRGTVDLQQAHVHGDVRFAGADLTGPAVGQDTERRGASLFAEELRAGTLGLGACRARGAIYASRSELRILNMIGAVVDAPHSEDCISFSMSNISTGVFFRAEEQSPGLDANGCVRFRSARIGTVFDADGASIEASGKGPRGHVALDLSETKIDGSVLLGCATRVPGKPRFTTTGAVLLRDAHVNGKLDLGGCDIAQRQESHELHDLHHDRYNPITVAVDAAGLELRGHLHLGQASGGVGSSFRGQVRFEAARAFRDVDLTGGSFSPCPTLKPAELRAPGRKPSEGMPEPSLDACWEDLLDRTALSLRNARIDGDLVVEDEFEREPRVKRTGIFDLEGARVSVLRDLQGTGWNGPTDGGRDKPLFELKLPGFTYDRAGAAGVIREGGGRRDIAVERVAWLRSQLPMRGMPSEEQYTPETYNLVERTLVKDDKLEDAARVRIARYRLRRELGVDPLYRRMASWLHDKMFLFGFGHWRALGWLALLMVLGTFVGLGLSVDSSDPSKRKQAEACSFGAWSYAFDQARLFVGVPIPIVRAPSGEPSCQLAANERGESTLSVGRAIEVALRSLQDLRNAGLPESFERARLAAIERAAPTGARPILTIEAPKFVFLFFTWAYLVFVFLVAWVTYRAWRYGYRPDRM